MLRHNLTYEHDMAKNRTGFIRVTKDNAKRDRGFIAIDAICSVFENQDAHNVSIMTMDGFWYDVVDNIETLYGQVVGDYKSKDVEQQEVSKKDYFRRKKMMTPSTANERAQQSHEDFTKTIRDAPQKEQEGDVFCPTFKKSKREKKNVTIPVRKDLPSGEGEGHDNSNRESPSRDATEV